jgi:hypothetical protein
LNLRPLGPQPSALPDCATPRGDCILPDRRPGGLTPTTREIRTLRHAQVRTLPWGEAAGGLCLAAEGSRASGQLLPTVPCRLQSRALPGSSPAIHQAGAGQKEGDRGRTARLSRRLSTRASLRRLRGHRPRRDCKVRGRLCKLSSTPHRSSGWLRSCGGSSTVEPRPSKAMMRVQFPSAALVGRIVVRGTPGTGRNADISLVPCS